MASSKGNRESADRALLTGFELLVIVPTLSGLVYLGSQNPAAFEDPHNLTLWTLIVAFVELLPVPTWGGLQVSLGFPLLMVVGILYAPVAAGAVALIGSFDPREFRREVDFLRALFNRSQVAVSVAAASFVFHAVAGYVTSASPPAWWLQLAAVIVAAIADYLANVSLVTMFASIRLHLPPSKVIRQFRIGRPAEFLVSYLGLGLLSLVVVQFYLNWGLWSVVVFIAPMLLARQMFFRSLALEEAHKELQDREQVLRALSNRMAEERQDERAQIAAYLHDDLAQLLFRLSIQVDLARRHLDSGRLEKAEETLSSIKETKNKTSDRIRALIRDLHRSPLGRAGLAEALEGFIAEVGKDSGVRFRVDVQEIPLPPPIALLLYHIAREGVMNALKHAEARNMWVTVREEGDSFELVLRDDGKGFDTIGPGPEGHYGMAMMRERALVGGGSFDVRSAPGAGTTITVRFPTSLLQEAAQTEPESEEGTASSATSSGGASPSTPEEPAAASALASR